MMSASSRETGSLGKIKAEQEFEVYREIQDKNYLSDFDKEIKRIMGENGKND
jgi:hypothetical protein